MGTHKVFKPRWEPGGEFKHRRICSGGKKFKTGNGRKTHMQFETENKTKRTDWKKENHE